VKPQDKAVGVDGRARRTGLAGRSTTRSWLVWLWLLCRLPLGGSLALVALSYASYRIRVDFTTAAFLLLTLLSILSLGGRIIISVLLSIVAIFALDYLFVAPLFSFGVTSRVDFMPLVAFLSTSAIITILAASARKKAEDELRETRAALARFARVATLGELTASIAHEVNQPLAGVVSSGNACLRWLAAEPPNIERASQSVTRIIRDANRASDVVQRVRSLVKNTPPAMVAVNVNEAALEITVLLKGEIERNRVTLALDLAENLPLVRADRVQLQQVIMNLTGNAVEALQAVGEGPRDLQISTRPAGPEVMLVIRDNGIGFEPARSDEMFNAFYTTKSEGMGMGLAISRSIIESHGGRLWAEANRPRGAAFHVTVPIL
jgi:signal transduction histidine kinase